MTREEILDALAALNSEQHLGWMIDLGMFLTIVARGGDPPGEAVESIKHLQGFNEIQHKVYGRMQHLRTGNAWPVEFFVDEVIEKARFHGIEGDVGWAVKTTLERLSGKE